MTALLRYAFLKSWREQIAIGLLLAPVVMLALPLLMFAGNNLRLGRPVYPFLLDPRLGPGGTAALIGEVMLAICGIVAGVAAFRVFAREIAAKGLGFFYLAQPPWVVALSSTIYGTAIGVGSYVVGMSVVSLLTASVPLAAAKQLLIVFLSSSIASALAAVMVRISTDATMLVPVYVAGAATGLVLLDSGTPAKFGMAVAIAVVTTVIAQVLWGRRCAV